MHSVKKKQICIGLLSHTFTSDNLGCGALSIANLKLINESAKGLNIQVEYKMCWAEGPLNYWDTVKQFNIEFKKLPRIRKMMIIPSSLTNFFKECDCIIDITMGDSFSDLYGWKRFLLCALVKYLLIKEGKSLIFAPQTIGPFKNKLIRMVARYILKKSDKIMVRDYLSWRYVRSLGIRSDVEQYTDVAFVLPYQRWSRKQEKQKFCVGLNVSGLLWKDYDMQKKLFKLSFDYRTFTEELLKVLIHEYKYEVHLIPHVLFGKESDYPAIKELKKCFPEVIIPCEFKSPSDAKAYISRMDLFIGARMHATIAAFSSFVPVIPISYSRKFEGIYNSIGYDFVIDAQKHDLNSALTYVRYCIANKSTLEKVLIKGNEIVLKTLNEYKKSIGRIMVDIYEKKKNDC